MGERSIKSDFPILSRQVHGRRLVYLDNAATTQKPKAVLEALKKYYEQYNANVHRGIYLISEEATMAFESVRDVVASFINARSREEVIFTRGATESINLVANSWGRANLKPGDEIVLSVVEHHSNLVPWFLVSRATGAQIRYIELENGTLSNNWPISPRTKIVAITGMSNVLGILPPVQRIAKAAHDVGAVVLVDGAQSVPHLGADVQALGCDFLAFSGHKMLGPTGVGVLWGRRELLEKMEPFLGGGDMIREVRLDGATWNDLPWKFEAGTPNIADVIALGEAIAYLKKFGMGKVREHEKKLTAYALEKLQADDRVAIYGPTDPEQRGGVISMNFGELHPHDVAQVLDRAGVAVRAGHHCCQPLMRKLGVLGTLRASFYIYNTEEDIDVFVAALDEVEKFFGRQPRANGKTAHYLRPPTQRIVK